MSRRGDVRQMDLLTWEAPRARVGYEDGEVRAATLGGRLCRAMAVALKECGRSRAQVAEAMGVYLGKQFSKHMLDAYVSQGREEHIPNLLVFAALVEATGDARLLSVLPETFGHMVVHSRHEPAIDFALRAEQQREIEAEVRRRADNLQTEWSRIRGATP